MLVSDFKIVPTWGASYTAVAVRNVAHFFSAGMAIALIAYIRYPQAVQKGHPLS